MTDLNYFAYLQSDIENRISNCRSHTTHQNPTFYVGDQVMWVIKRPQVPMGLVPSNVVRANK